MTGRYTIDEPVVMVPARVASILHQYLTPLRTKLRGQDAQVDQVLLDIAYQAMAHRAARGTSVAPQREPTRDLTEWVSTSTAAERIGVSPRAIRRAIEQGRLAGRYDDGRWRISRENVEHFRAGRTTRMRETR